VRRAALLLLAAAALGGCGGGSDSDGGAASSEATVSVEQVGGVGDVLVDADGAALYASEQESSGAVKCVGSCAAIWRPLTITGQPVASDEVAGKLGVVERPDGTSQVTFDGTPLYSFIEDAGDGVVKGNGLADDFDGHAFTWHVMTPDGPSASDDKSEQPSDSGSPYGGGYGR
jgi:predicted lipoprotein with Yx(FWY)xxD motif